MAVDRTPEWIEREYGREKWPAVAAMIESVLAAEGPGASLGRVLAQVTARDVLDGRDPLDVVEVPFAGSLVGVPAAAMMGGIEAVVAGTLDRWCHPDTDLVIELGSGWARNVLTFASSLGPPRARYVGAEYTAAGRDCADRLAALDPALDFSSLAFDYRAPDLGSLRARRALVFTVHSVEQVPALPAAVVDEIRGVAPHVTCVHVEPVGWQIGGSAFTSPAYAERHDYNRNLWALLSQEAAEGRLSIDRVAVDVCGVNPANASSVLAWSSRRPGPPGGPDRDASVC